VLGVIGETLPLAIAIAFSPFGIVSVVVMLLSSYPRTTSIGFVLGWASGIAIVGIAGYLLAGLVPEAPDDGRVVGPIALVVLGLLSIGFAVRQWRSRPGADDEGSLPSWMSRIDGLSGFRSFAFGTVLAATKPKNIILAFGSGVAASTAGLVGAQAVIVLGVFLSAASISLGAPVIAFLVAGERVNGGLERIRDWMIRHNSAMLGVIMLFVGVLLVGNGLRGL
jgi:hypothetical protein